MADIRRSFDQKYSELHNRWGIDADLLHYIIRRYEKLLTIENEKVKKETIKLPRHFRDRRTDQEYIYDLVDGWVIEDIICDAWLRPKLLDVNRNIHISIMGTNRDREIQKLDHKKITTMPDFLFTNGEVETAVELQMARKELSGGYDMKVGKVNRAIADNGLFLWVIIPNDEFFIIDPKADMKNISPTPNPLWGGKLVYHITQDFIKSIGGYHKMIAPLNEININKLRIS